MTVDSNQWFRASGNQFRKLAVDEAAAIPEMIEALPLEGRPYSLILSKIEKVGNRYQDVLEVVDPRDLDNLETTGRNCFLASEAYSPGILARLNEETSSSLSLQGLPVIQYRRSPDMPPLSIASVTAIVSSSGERIDHVEYAAVFRALLAAARRIERQMKGKPGHRK